MATTLKEVLKQHNYSVTHPRKIIFEVLLSLKGPVSMSELIVLVSGRIDRATVYRTVDIFEKSSVVNRIQTGWKYKLELSDKFLSHHHHLTCVECGDVVSFLESSSLINELKSLEKSLNFKITSHSIELSGFCRNCR